GRRSLALPQSAEILHLDRNGKILVLAHRLGRLAMDHRPAVALGPGGPAGTLLANEPILDSQSIVREFVLVEDVPELVIEFVILIVGDLEQAILDAKRGPKIIAQRIALDLRRPA